MAGSGCNRLKDLRLEQPGPDEFKKKRDEAIVRRVKINRGGKVVL